MILDGYLAFTSTAYANGAPASAGDSVVNGTGTFSFSNVIDLGVPTGIPPSTSGGGGGGARDLGVGDHPSLKILAQITSPGLNGTSGTTTLQLVIQGAPDSGAGIPGTWYNMALSPVYTFTTTTGPLIRAGERLMELDLPRYPDDQPVPRFLRMQYIIGGAAITATAAAPTGNGASTIEALLVLDRIDQIGSQTGLLSGYQAGVVVPN